MEQLNPTEPDSHAEIAAQGLLRNRQQLGKRLGLRESAHTPPAAGHYPHIYNWDGMFAAIIFARAGGERWLPYARSDIAAVFDGQRADGSIPGTRYMPGMRTNDPERLAAGKNAVGTIYSQPPLYALALAETHDAMAGVDQAVAADLLAEFYPKAKLAYAHLEKYRSNSRSDKLIGVIHPHATGRDSDPTFDFAKPHRLARRGDQTPLIVDGANMVLDYIDSLILSRRQAKALGPDGADIAKARENFWVNDVMMNCIYADNLGLMAQLAERQGEMTDAQHFTDLASGVERAILAKLWHEPDRRFYALDARGQHIKETTVSNLAPLLLKNLPEPRLEAILDLMDSSFNTPFPLPSVATDSRNFDPHNLEKDRLWRGGVWMFTNWLICRGLGLQLARTDLSQAHNLQQRLSNWAQKIAERSRLMVDLDGAHEHNHPYSGTGQRRRVKNFSGAYLAYVM